MERRHFLRLGAVASGVFAVGGGGRLTEGLARAQTLAVPTVDRLVMTTVVDNIYDIFAKGGKLDSITVERAPYPGKANALLAEIGPAYPIKPLHKGDLREHPHHLSLAEPN